MSKAIKSCASVVLCYIFMSMNLSLQLPHSFAESSSKGELDKAIATLRNVVPAELTEEEEEKKADEIEKAWDVIQSAGNPGVSRLKQEIELIDRGPDKDDWFKLNAAALLWVIGKLENAEAIAAVWKSTNLTVQKNYVFYPACEAAQTQDPRALPMLKACLRDKEGGGYASQHALEFAWPLNQQFIWGAFGPRGLPVLHDVLQHSKHPSELQSAMVLLSDAHYLKALPIIREHAAHGQGDVRDTAVRCVGKYGHPQDYKLLIEGLKTKDPDQLFNQAYALYEYGDLRAVPHLIPLLGSDDEALRNETISCLMYLLTPDSFEALQTHLKKIEADEERAELADWLDYLLRPLEVSAEALSAKSPKERAKLITALRERREAKGKLTEKDRRLSRDEFLEACKQWKSNHRITGGKYEWVEDRHVLAVATPQDLDLLREVKASLYFRLSDECLYEVRTLDELLKRISRSRYRKVVGVCEKAEPME